MKRQADKKRLDRLVAEMRPELSRSRIQAEIMAGRVMVNSRQCDKPGTLIEGDALIAIKEPQNPYVSRGGLKLEGALKDFSLNVENMVVLDVGASTGGFTDCLLQKGAGMVYAVDVGYGQLDYKLRSDPRIINMERTNIRNLEKEQLAHTPDLAVVDVSFISLSKVFTVLGRINVPLVIALVKPQFEVGRIEASRGEGVVRDPDLQGTVLEQVINYACSEGYGSRNISFSKIKGPKGNIEYFILFERRSDDHDICLRDSKKVIEAVVKRAHVVLNKEEDKSF